MIKIEFSTESAAFEDSHYEVARILEQLAEHVRDNCPVGRDAIKIFDDNGNHVGWFDFDLKRQGTITDLVLTLRNMRELYNKHLEMYNLPIRTWIDHVRLMSYHQVFEGRKFSDDAIMMAADELRDHYREEWNEGARPSK